MACKLTSGQSVNVFTELSFEITLSPCFNAVNAPEKLLTVPFGSWFDHNHGWLSMRGKENFLIISYEELHQDTTASVERINQFLGKKLNAEELNSVLKKISFEVMKDNKMSNLSLLPDEMVDHSKGKLMRKRQVQDVRITGDWKNHFTVAQSEVFDTIYQEKMGVLPQGLFPWE
ncbi:sulfotransferase 2A1-like [Trichechus inunguis]